MTPAQEAHDRTAQAQLLPSPEALAALTAGWDFLGEQDGMRLFVANKALFELRLGALQKRAPAQREEQLRSLLSRGLDSWQALHLVSDERGKSQAGWPLRILHATVLNAGRWEGGERLHRFVAHYQFFEHEGEALLQVGSEMLWTEHQSEILALLRSGWPQFTPPEGVAALSELWQ